MFCVECGAEGEVHDGLCRECYIKRRKFVSMPKMVDILVCAHCGALKIGAHWHKVDDAIYHALGEALVAEKDVDVTYDAVIEEEDERNFKVTLKVDIRTRGMEHTEELTTKVRVKMGVCQDCSRQRGSYYEAIVQLRARKRGLKDDEIEEFLAMAQNLVEASGSFITKMQEVKGGLDLYMGRMSDGRALATSVSNRFGARTGETKSLAGRKDGRDIFRTTFVVRLPLFCKGDLVPLEGKIYEIRSFNKNKANLEEITSGLKTSCPMKEVEGLPLLDREGHLKRTVVVSEQENEVQVMHPESYRTVEVMRSDLFKAGTKEILVVVYEEDIFPYLI